MTPLSSAWWGDGSTEPPHYGVSVVPDGALVEPITLEDAKLFLRVTVADEDAFISQCITAARIFCENRIGRAIALHTVDVFYDRLDPTGWITLPFGNVAAVTSIKTTDVAGLQSTINPSLYLVDVASEPARIGLPTGQTWPTGLRSFQAVAIRLSLGYTQAPEDLLQALRLLIGHYYEDRAAALPASRIGTVLPLGVDDHLAPYEQVRLI